MSYKSVALTELEFNKLLRYNENVTAVEAQVELLLSQLKEKVAASQRQREAYFLSLVDKYPDLSKEISYGVDESTLSLVPNVKEPQPVAAAPRAGRRSAKE